MKVPASVRAVYEANKPRFDRLKAEVDRRIVGFKNERWHYESRIKSEESFALKLETGRFPDADNLEDFFACTLVVPNLSGIEAAEKMVAGQFQLKERRPRSKSRTHKAPDSFPFDDVRLYVVIPEDPRYPPSGLESIRFEIQIKTFLQHAWSIATHDLIYKSSSVSWPQERIAFQVKAMLEHAELSIEEATSLAKSQVIAKTDGKVRRVSEIMKLIVEHWKADAPHDIKRLASNIDDVCEAVEIKPAELAASLAAYLVKRGDSVPENLFPYQAIVEALCESQEKRMTDYLYGAKTANSKMLLLTKETALPRALSLAKIKRAVIMK